MELSAQEVFGSPELMDQMHSIFYSTHPLANVAMPTSVNFIPTPMGRAGKDRIGITRAARKGQGGSDSPFLHNTHGPGPICGVSHTCIQLHGTLPGRPASDAAVSGSLAL